jgi:hypothetical protein
VQYVVAETDVQFPNDEEQHMQNPGEHCLDQERLLTLFNDERWCISYLFARRWPNGFICPCCKRMSSVKTTERKFTCPVCGHAMSITSGTLFHGTKKHLSQWLLALWMLCSSKRVNCRKLQEKLAIQSYHTAWQWRQKLLAIIEVANDRKCHGIVETESTAIQKSKSTDNTAFIIAAKEISTDQDFTGWLRLDYCPDLTVSTIMQFVEDNIEKNSMVIVPDRIPYTLISPGEFRFIPEPGTAYLAHTTSILQDFLTDSQFLFHQRKGAVRRLRKQLTDFSFQVNKRLYPDTVTLFEHMVTTALHFRPSFTALGSKQPEIQRGSA